MRRGSFVGLLLVVSSIVVSACGDAPGNPVSPSSAPAAIAPTRITLVSGVELPIGGGTASITISTDNGTLPAPLVRVSLVASGGALSLADVTTDSTGHATVTWTGTESATISAASGTLASALAITVRLAPVVPPSSPTRKPPVPPTDPTPTTPTTPGLGVVITPQYAAVETAVRQTYTVSLTQTQPGEAIASVSWLFETGATATTSGPTWTYAYTTHGVKTIKVTVVSTAGRTALGSGTAVITSPQR